MSVNTRFEEIYRLFLGSIQDYELQQIFTDNPEIGEEILEIFLLRAIPLFLSCRKYIDDVDIVDKTFYDILDLEEKTILSDLMLLSWMDRTINDITQMGLNLNDNDFKHYSEEKNLQQKSEYADRLREKVYQRMTDYQLHHTPFRSWAVGDYGI